MMTAESLCVRLTDHTVGLLGNKLILFHFIAIFTFQKSKTLFYMNNKDLNRIKVVLVEHKRANKWLTERVLESSASPSKKNPSTIYLSNFGTSIISSMEKIRLSTGLLSMRNVRVLLRRLRKSSMPNLHLLIGSTTSESGISSSRTSKSASSRMDTHPSTLLRYSEK